MRPQQLLQQAAATLAAAGFPSPAADARLLLSHALGVEPPEWLRRNEVSADSLDRFEKLLGRRLTGEPVQHLTGQAPFRYLLLAVGPGVFIPRPETEILVDLALAELSSWDPATPPIVVDLATGSGAIAAAIATEVPGSQVHAVELDPAAMVWAHRNLDGTGVHLVRADLADALPELNGLVDLVTCNPPYLPLTDQGDLPTDVLGFDPALALFAGEDGLAVIRVLLDAAARLLKPGGVLIFEHDESHGDSAPTAVHDHVGFDDGVSRRDLTGRPRFVSARRS